MTDAEFMLEYVTEQRKLVVVFVSAQRYSELDALEALANLSCDRDVEFDEDDIATIICHKCEALHKFRAAMEGKDAQ